MSRIIVDGTPVEFQAGDSIAVAIARTGAHPFHGGCLCLAGDCPNCVAVVDGIGYVRTCQTPARPGTVVERHPATGGPSLYGATGGEATEIRHLDADVVVIGAGAGGTAAAEAARKDGREVLVFDAKDGNEVVGVYAGPAVIVRSSGAMLHVHAHGVVVATGAAELHPVCPGNRLAGIVTRRAAERLHAAGVDLGRVVAVGAPPTGLDCTVAAGTLVRFDGVDSAGVPSGDAGGGRVIAVVVRDGDGVVHTHPCDTAVIGLGLLKRDVLVRSALATIGESVLHVVDPTDEAGLTGLPPAPTDGMVCPCSRVTVEDLHGVWDRGFQELELVKRASLCGTGTCQGSVCGPYLQAFVADRRGDGATPLAFTARPAVRQLTIGEAAVNVHVDAFRRTPLHDEHVKLGARMDRFGGWWRPWHYGDHVAEYWAVREGVSLGDVSTLGKLVVDGPDSVEALERIYPTTIADIRPGRSRYVLLLNERGHVIDDGMVCRETDTRFVLTFTSGGAASAEMWMRDWIEAWGLRVHVLDRTMSLAAINVTGPLAGELLQRVGVAEPPKFLQHRHDHVAGVPCHVMRLSFTGEASFELHHAVDQSVELWRALMEAGRPLGIRPHGLQALFGLRLEKGHVIVGMDTEMDTTPRRIGMEWAVKMDKPTFLGKPALTRTAPLVDHRRLVALTMDGAAPTEGTPVFDAAGNEILGHVSSTFFSPQFCHSVMLGWVKRGWDPEGPLPATLLVDGRVATLTHAPFYDKEGARARL